MYKSCFSIIVKQQKLAKIPRLLLREGTLEFRDLIVRLEKSLIVCLEKSGVIGTSLSEKKLTLHKMIGVCDTKTNKCICLFYPTRTRISKILI